MSATDVIIATLTELANDFERMTDTQAIDIALFIYEWEPPWFIDIPGHKWDWMSKEAEATFQARVIDIVYALRTAVKVMGNART